MKVGIGVISYKRPKECLEVCQSIIKTLDHSNHSYTLIAAIDQEDITEYADVVKIFPISHGKNGGVAVNKNRALYKLKDCDIVFLFEDDFKPTRVGWVDLYINATKETGMQHFNYIRLDHRETLLKIIRTANLTLGVYQRNTAQLMVMTGAVIQKIGAFDERYGRFGYEHSDYTRRCKTVGLCQPACHDAHPFVLESDLYFKDMGTTPCFNEQERIKYSEEANKIYMQFNPRNIYIPFTQEKK